MGTGLAGDEGRDRANTGVRVALQQGRRHRGGFVLARALPFGGLGGRPYQILEGRQEESYVLRLA
jgi:hypothetical protein